MRLIGARAQSEARNAAVKIRRVIEPLPEIPGTVTTDLHGLTADRSVAAKRAAHILWNALALEPLGEETPDYEP